MNIIREFIQIVRLNRSQKKIELSESSSGKAANRLYMHPERKA